MDEGEEEEDEVVHTRSELVQMAFEDLMMEYEERERETAPSIMAANCVSALGPFPMRRAAKQPQLPHPLCCHQHTAVLLCGRVVSSCPVLTSSPPTP